MPPRRTRAVWHLGPDDATLVCLPMAWAFGLVTTSMAALLTGGRVVALARAEPEAMLGAMADHGVTFFAGVTTMFGKLVQHLDARDGPRPDLVTAAAVHLRRRAAERGGLLALAAS